MENILKVFNGWQAGEQYLFAYKNKKFVATLGYDGVVDYGWRDKIIIKQVGGSLSNTFRFKKGAFRDGEVKYYDNKLGFVVITDFSYLTNEIKDWINFMI